MNNYILNLIAKRRAVFRREGRSEEWKKLKKRTRAAVKHRKAEHNKKKKEKMLGCESKTFHKCVRAVVSDDKPKTWSPRQLFPDLDARGVAEKCAEFFNGISSEYDPLDINQIPRSHDTEELIITPKMVQDEIEKGAKPKSRVPGDVFINVITQNAAVLSKPIAEIYNTIIKTGEWPSQWLTEYVTVIPKGNQPEEPAQCRNISCTNFLSKLLERLVLAYARGQVVPKDNQFGGEKGCSTDHFLAEVWDSVTEHLEDPRAAAILTSIDYSKAFNRLDHTACLKVFVRKGASNQLVKLLASFLRGRTMTVKVDSEYSTPRQVNAGAPQGSVLGTYIFNIGTDDLEQGLEHEPLQNTYELNEGDLSFLETLPQTTYAESTPKAIRFPTYPDITPIHNRSTQRIQLLPTARNIPPSITNRIEPTWRPKPIAVKKFVDDNLQIEKLSMRYVPGTEVGDEVFRFARAGASERTFRHIASNAQAQGLKINTNKTTILTTSAATSYQARSHIYDNDNQRIDCVPTLKTLGFTFNREGSVSNQVDNLCRRFRSRTWTLRDLRKSGFTTEELLRVYKSTIRPTIEYSAVIYHSMLNTEQENLIEWQQTRALKNIFGNEYSQARLLQMSGVPSLKERREAACLRFATKMSGNVRFEHHFRRRQSGARSKERTEFVEMRARTNRRMNSPLYYYRRILNRDRVHYN